MTSRFKQDRFKVAVVGCHGKRAKLWIKSVLALADEGVELVAVVDPHLPTASLAGLEFGVRAFSSLAQAIERKSPGGVIVALPEDDQEEAVIDAGNRGLHVFCCEPFGSSLDEARRMIRAGDGKGLVLAAGYPEPAQYQWSHDLAEVGDLGSPILLEAGWRLPVAQLEGVGKTLARRALAAGLPLVGSRPIQVTASCWTYGEEGGWRSPLELAQALRLDVDFENGAHAQVVVDGAWWGQAEAPFVRCRGTRGLLLMPLREAEPDGEAYRPTFIGSGGKDHGDVPATVGEALLDQLRNWVLYTLGTSESLVADPDVALQVHAVLEASRKSNFLAGRQIVI